MTIHDLIIDKRAQYTNKPAQDVFDLLLTEHEEEGPQNDGLLATYIREAEEALHDIRLLIDEDILYRKLLGGETIEVQVSSTGKVFTIRPAEYNPSRLPAYDILTRGKVEKRGIILDKQALRNWCYGLVIVNQ